jgi:hypothetical protein
MMFLLHSQIVAGILNCNAPHDLFQGRLVIDACSRQRDLVFCEGTKIMPVRVSHFSCSPIRSALHCLMMLCGLLFASVLLPASACADLQVGAAVVDVTPAKLPVLVNGGMLSRSLDKVKTPVNARAIVVADETSQLAIVVVDSCMMGRVLLDDVKALTAIRTGIPANRILISATHTHTAPASMGCLGTDADPAYVPVLREKLVEAIATAQARLQPAEVGFARTRAPEHTALRQWIRRPDRIGEDPFGNMTVRANMHAGANWDDAVGEAGPEDPELSLISFRTRAGQPLAVLANFSMHYFSDTDISADYFGLFCNGLKNELAPDGDFVGIMSHGCSGDIWRRDYTRPESWNPKLTIDEYADSLLQIALKAFEGIVYRHDVTIAMAEQRMTLSYRVPDRQLLEWSERIVKEIGDRLPKDTTEVYAREQILLHQTQQTEIVVQALRIGEIGIATTPNETYAITGLKIKASSPLDQTMVIELANGGDGYIPPPEQHALGGYNTWPARSAGLEVQAEPKITQAALNMLETVSGRPRSLRDVSAGRAVDAILAAKPAAYWRLNEFSGPIARDATGNHRDGTCEHAMTWYLEGPLSTEFSAAGSANRAPHFVGARLRSRFPDLQKQYSLSMWIWNGMPVDGRGVTGWFYSRDHDQGLSEYGEHIGLGGTDGHTGRLIFQSGTRQTLVAGTTEIPRWSWHHVVLVRDGESIRIYLDGKLDADGTAPVVSTEELFFGGRSDGDSTWEGRLDEIAVFSRALTADEVSKLFPALDARTAAAQ